MSLLDVILLAAAAVYGLSALVAWRAFAGAVAWDMKYGRHPDTMDWLFGMFIGIFGAVVWPLVALGPPLFQHLSRPLERTRFQYDVERRGREIARTRDLTEREERVREAERELGIK